jgi:hypothetical protein
MTVPVEAITHERLARWERKLAGEHATPILLLGVGHDHVSGQLVICTCEEVSDAQLVAFLRAALEMLNG